VRILVTGGAGFIGSNLIHRLLADGHVVVCMDNLSTGRLKNIKAFLDSRDFEFVEGDVRTPYAFEVDQVYNLACPASPPRYQADPIGTTMTSVLGTKHALELGQATGARVLQASTSEVYGDPEVHPQSEEYVGAVNPVGQRACYDEGKRVAESLCFDFHRQFGTDVRVARIFNTYGPMMDPDDGRVISNMVVAALQGLKLPVYGSGEQTRSFCFVDDLVDGLIAIMNQTVEVGPYNVGNPEERSIAEVGRIVAEAVGTAVSLEFTALPVDDPKRRRPDISRLTEATGWKPSRTFQEGLARTVDYFRRELAREA
jgi:UDP-glucuronate decarboxylase